MNLQSISSPFDLLPFQTRCNSRESLTYYHVDIREGDIMWITEIRLYQSEFSCP